MEIPGGEPRRRPLGPRGQQPVQGLNRDRASGHRNFLPASAPPERGAPGLDDDSHPRPVAEGRTSRGEDAEDGRSVRVGRRDPADPSKKIPKDGKLLLPLDPLVDLLPLTTAALPRDRTSRGSPRRAVPEHSDDAGEPVRPEVSFQAHIDPVPRTGVLHKNHASVGSTDPPALVG